MSTETGNGTGQGSTGGAELVPFSRSAALGGIAAASCPPSCCAPVRPTVFAAEEFFFGTIRNDHTRRAYLHAVNRFLALAEIRSLELARIAPRDVGQYLSGLGKTTSIATRKQHLAARATSSTAWSPVTQPS